MDSARSYIYPTTLESCNFCPLELNASTVMSPQISAPGLTEDQIKAEIAWLNEFMQAGDSLDWSRWEKGWEEDAFLQYGNSPRLQGKAAIANYFKEQLGMLEYMHHDLFRFTFDLPLGLVYQASNVKFKIKGDPKGRTIQLPALGVLHKRVGEKVLSGCEVYVDKGPLAAVAQEILQGKGA
ncbi:unnamed protein product [Rhizoctonia solani]|uniref:SnoaL-like domain-containing protein n=1 Tax=Rhizoctonia solani TaxID=456999 RepID=A0A8H3CT25_9AGAM|nr:unnamed protein product [Rhizoctonia solani]